MTRYLAVIASMVVLGMTAAPAAEPQTAPAVTHAAERAQPSDAPKRSVAEFETRHEAKAIEAARGDPDRAATAADHRQSGRAIAVSGRL